METSETTTRCRSCHAEIFYLPTISGALMPLDAEPCWDGTVVNRDGRAHVLRKGEFEEASDEPKFKSHYATCPYGARHRKK